MLRKTTVKKMKTRMKNPRSSSRLLSIAEAIVNLQAERAKAHRRLVTIMAEARQLRATLLRCDQIQSVAQADLEVLAEQQ